MTRYPQEHKDQSRAALVDAAANLFRRHGFTGVGINDLCGAAGFTRGVFYAHFSSKAGLLTAVLGGAHDMLRRLRERRAKSGAALVRQGAGVAAEYLKLENRRAVLSGCSIAALAVDVARADAEAQAAYAKTVDAVVEEFARGDHGPDADNARAALALCVGGLLVSSACGDSPTARAVSRAANSEVQRLLTANIKT